MDEQKTLIYYHEKKNKLNEQTKIAIKMNNKCPNGHDNDDSAKICSCCGAKIMLYGKLRETKPVIYIDRDASSLIIGCLLIILAFMNVLSPINRILYWGGVIAIGFYLGKDAALKSFILIASIIGIVVPLISNMDRISKAILLIPSCAVLLLVLMHFILRRMNNISKEEYINGMEERIILIDEMMSTIIDGHIKDNIDNLRKV